MPAPDMTADKLRKLRARYMQMLLGYDEAADVGAPTDYYKGEALAAGNEASSLWPQVLTPPEYDSDWMDRLIEKWINKRPNWQHAGSQSQSQEIPSWAQNPYARMMKEDWQ